MSEHGEIEETELELPDILMIGLAELREDGFRDGFQQGREAGHEDIDEVNARQLWSAQKKGREEGIKSQQEAVDQQHKQFIEILSDLRRLHPEIAPDLPLLVLDLSERPRNVLTKNKITTLGQVAVCSADELLSLNFFGSKSLEEVETKLFLFGLNLRQPE